MQVGSVVVQIATDLRSFIAGLNTATREARSAATTMEREFRTAFGHVDSSGSAAANALSKNFKEVGRIVSGILISQAFYGSLNAIQDAAQSVFEFSMTLQDAQTKWTALLGSSTEATKWVAAMQDFAQKTPFDFAQVDEAAAKIRMMGVDAKAVLPILETLGNAVAINGGDSLQLTRLTTVLRQMWQSPTVQKQDINQLIQGGQIDAVRYLKQELHLTAAEVSKIGKIGISGKTAAIAILKGMATDPAYANGMKKLSENTRGMLESIRDGAAYFGSLIFSPAYDKISGFVRKVRDAVNEMTDVFQKHGIGGLFEKFIPKDLQPQIKTILASIKSLWDSVFIIFDALKPAFAAFGNLFLQSIVIILPIIASLVRMFANLLQTMQPLMPLIGRLAFVLSSLFVAATVSIFFMVLARSLKTFAITLGIVDAVSALGKALNGLLMLFAEPEVLAIIAIGGAILYVAMQSKEATRWIEDLLNRFYQLMGIDTSGILKAFNLKDNGTSDYIKSMRQDLMSVIDSAGGVGAEMDKNTKKTQAAKKAMDKYLESFDEVFQVPEKNNDGTSGGSGTGGGGIPGLGNGSKKKVGKEEPALPDDPSNNRGNNHPIVPFMKDTRDFKINIKWGWDPGPPGAAATVWIASMDAIRQSLQKLNLSPAAIAINGFVHSLQGIGQVVGPVMDLVAALALIGETVGKFGINTRGIFGSLKETVGDFATNTSKAFGRIVDLIGSLNLVPLIEKAFTNPVQLAIDAFAALPDNVKQSLIDVGKAIEDKKTVIVTTVSLLMAGVKTQWEKDWEDLKTKTEHGLNKVKSVFEQYKTPVTVAAGVIVTAIVALFAGIPASIGAAFATIGPTVGSKLSGITPAVKTALKDISSTVLSPFAGIPKGIDAIITGMVKGFKSFPDKMKDALKNLPDRFAEVIGGIKLPVFLAAAAAAVGMFKMEFLRDLPGFANGGIIGAESIVRVGEKGRREAIIPLENTTAMAPFADAVAARMGNIGGSQAPPQILYVGNLIADDRSLRELERKMQVIRLNEAKRGGIK